MPAQLKALMLGPPPLTLAVAESLTSGRLQARIGAISGASEFFLGGITAYSLEAKVRHLGVDRSAAAAANGVSAAIAEQMARGACTLFGADIAAATTGYAEPSPDWKVETPFAWLALARRLPTGQFEVRASRIDCPRSTRIEAQDRVADSALKALLDLLSRIRSSSGG